MFDSSLLFLSAPLKIPKQVLRCVLVSIRRTDLEVNTFFFFARVLLGYFSREDQVAIEDPWVRLSARDVSSHARK